MLRARCSHTDTFINTPGPPDGKTHNQIEPVLTDSIQVYLMYDLSEELTLMLTTIWWLQKLGKDWK